MRGVVARGRRGRRAAAVCALEVLGRRRAARGPAPPRPPPPEEGGGDGERRSGGGPERDGLRRPPLGAAFGGECRTLPSLEALVRRDAVRLLGRVHGPVPVEEERAGVGGPRGGDGEDVVVVIDDKVRVRVEVGARAPPRDGRRGDAALAAVAICVAVGVVESEREREVVRV